MLKSITRNTHDLRVARPRYITVMRFHEIPSAKTRILLKFQAFPWNTNTVLFEIRNRGWQLLSSSRLNLACSQRTLQSGWYVNGTEQDFEMFFFGPMMVGSEYSMDIWIVLMENLCDIFLWGLTDFKKWLEKKILSACEEWFKALLGSRFGGFRAKRTQYSKMMKTLKVFLLQIRCPHLKNRVVITWRYTFCIYTMIDYAHSRYWNYLNESVSRVLNWRSRYIKWSMRCEGVRRYA